MRVPRALWQILVLSSALGLSSAGLFAEVTVVEGEIGPGALYGFYVPENWNGDVVYFAHGMVDPSAPIELDPGFSAGYREPLLERGFAFVLSSFSENGVALKRGAIETHQLRGLFKSYFGNPRRSYLMGMSMGGGIVIPLIEDYPQQYDGAFVMCGLIGGTAHAMKQFFDFRVLFDYYYPGLLPGEVTSLPEGTTFVGDMLPLGFAAMSNSARALELLSVDQMEVEILNPATELPDAMIGKLASYTFWAVDFPDRVHDHNFYDNLDTLYTGSSDDAALNAGVERCGPVSRPAERYMTHYFEPTGNLAIPLITLHGERDPLVPLSHEAIYANLVAEQGASDLLLQRTSQTFGHCAFTQAEWLTAFTDLVTWVETGVKPAP